MKVKRKIMAIVLGVSLIFASSVPSALATEDHVHDEICGYSDGQCIYESDGAEEAEGAGNSAADAAESGEAAGSLDSDTDDESTSEGESDSGSGQMDEETGEVTESGQDNNSDEETGGESDEAADAEEETEELEESAAESLALTATGEGTENGQESGSDGEIMDTGNAAEEGTLSADNAGDAGENSSETGAETGEGSNKTEDIEEEDTGEGSGEAADAEEETEESEESAEESLTLTTAMSLTSASGNGWTLDDNGKLTISSDTGMSNWFSNRNSYMTQVKSVVIEDSVTYISSNAFKNASNLTSASIGSGVTAISGYAFQSCTSLASITINKATTTINDFAFSGCMSLTDVYYSGSETEWNNISIGLNNNYLSSAFIHYNSSSAHSHTHSTSFNWTGYSSCTVTVNCSGCNSTKTLNCTVTSETTDASITYTAKATFGTETYSGTKTVTRAPMPTVTISGVTTSSITVTAPSGTDQNTYGTAVYSIDGSTWQNSNVFNSLYAGTSYTVYVKYQGNSTYAESVSGSAATKTADATYTVTIPSTATAGGDSVYISIDESTLDLGLWGQVDVSVTFGLNTEGKLGLIREGDIATEINSQMYVNDVAVTSDTFVVTTFKEGNTSPVAIRFGELEAETIPAGKYSRQVQFTITFSQ